MGGVGSRSEHRSGVAERVPKSNDFRASGRGLPAYGGLGGETGAGVPSSNAPNDGGHARGLKTQSLSVGILEIWNDQVECCGVKRNSVTAFLSAGMANYLA